MNHSTDDPTAAWHPDPIGRHEHRYWDGSVWTEHVSDGGAVGSDPLEPATPVVEQQPNLDSVPPEALVGSSRLDAEVEVGSEAQRTTADGRIDKLLRRVESAPPKGGLFGRGRTEDLERDNADLRALLGELHVFERRRLVDEVAVLRSEQASLSREVVETRDRVLLQEVGVYEFRHPLDDAPAYKVRLVETRDRMKQMVKNSEAISAITGWTVNGSEAEGKRMVRDTGKLMLRAYNNEADNCVRTLKPYTLEAAITRLGKAREAIARLGKIMQLRITDQYHKMRVYELELTADYLTKQADEKERAREERGRMREEEIAQREFAREQAKLDKELAHRTSVLTALRAQGDADAISAAEAKLSEVQEAIEGITHRAANTRAGYVYVISNVGAFGERMVKIGMTRRLEPLDRVRELGDASVPFRYDVHALMFHEDAVGLETRLHHELSAQRVNTVNLRREFFYATPQEVRDVFDRLDVTLLDFTEEPEAIEWRQSHALGSARVSE